MRATQEVAVPAKSGFQRFSIAVLYGWLPQGKMVPVEFSLSSVTTEGGELQSRGRYYRRFSAQTRIVVAESRR